MNTKRNKRVKNKTIKITPSDIVLRFSETKKPYRVSRKKIPSFFYINENFHNQLRNSHKNYLSEFVDIEYNQKDIIFILKTPNITPKI